MCEILGVFSNHLVKVNPYINKLIEHSTYHPDGWGIAVFYNQSEHIEKEPLTANKSHYLKQRISEDFVVQNMIMHIRLATKGDVSYKNTHPFVAQDATNTTWTLVHNGTIFHCETLEKYQYLQNGSTDSERILLYIVDCLNQKSEKLKRPLSLKERFDVVDSVICNITKDNNKVNLIATDGILTYVHTNCQNTLYYKEVDDTLFVSTVPLDLDEWHPFPFTQLIAFKDGNQVFFGTNHHHEYIYNEEEMKYLYLEQSCL